MPKTTSTTTVEDKARNFLNQGFAALYDANTDVPKVMDKQVVYLDSLSKMKSRAGLTDQQIALVQRLVKGQGTKEEASGMIDLLIAQENGEDNIARAPQAADAAVRDVEAAKADVRALLGTYEEARATYQTLSVISEPADPNVCTYCDRDEDNHAGQMHEFEGPEPEAILSYAAQHRMVVAENALTEYFANLSE